MFEVRVTSTFMRENKNIVLNVHCGTKAIYLDFVMFCWNNFLRIKGHIYEGRIA